jgi:predicted DNA-binding antitoxin AbrB/MazE fold protein
MSGVLQVLRIIDLKAGQQIAIQAISKNLDVQAEWKKCPVAAV